MTEIEKLVDGSIAIAIRAAVCVIGKVKIDEKFLMDELKRQMELELPVALDNARDAVECRMDKVAVRAFGASMHLVGIRAAKAALEKAKGVPA